MKIPIILFCYNRPNHFERVVNSIKENLPEKNNFNLFIVCDGPKNDYDHKQKIKILNLINKINFIEKNFIERKTNYGWKKNISITLDDLFKRYEAVIILNDDNLIKKGFFEFIDEAYKKYMYQEKVQVISGYNYPFKFPANYEYDAYFTNRCGIASVLIKKSFWSGVSQIEKSHLHVINSKKDRELLNSSGEDNIIMFIEDHLKYTESMGIWFSYFLVKKEYLCLRPKISLMENIGYDNSGMHCVQTNKYTTQIDSPIVNNFKLPDSLSINKKIHRTLLEFLKPNLIKHLLYKLLPLYVIKMLNIYKYQNKIFKFVSLFKFKN